MKLTTQEKVLIRLALLNANQNPPDWMDDSARLEVTELINKFTGSILA